jgi:hypothetical protein
VRVITFGERGIEGIAAANDRGVFVSVTPPADETNRQVAEASEEEEEDDRRGGVRLYESLYETALKNELPRQTVDELVRIFGYDVDFQRRVSQGDAFEIFYGSDDENGTPEVLYASLTVGGEARRVYRYQGEDGTVDFFDDAGRSLKKFLIRKPIADGILRSGFGSRFHPILGYSRPHTGIDWANKVGTPILAAGNGTVRFADWKSDPARQRLCDDLFPHVGLCQEHESRRQGPAGSGHRLSGQHGPVDRPSPPLRGAHQRQLRRSSQNPPAARKGARGPWAGGLQAPARTGR